MLHAWRVHQRCRVLRNKPPLGGVTKCAAQAAVNVTDSLGAQLSAAHAAVAKELAVKLAQMHGTKFLDRHIAKMRLHWSGL